MWYNKCSKSEVNLIQENPLADYVELKGPLGLVLSLGSPTWLYRIPHIYNRGM